MNSSETLEKNRASYVLVTDKELVVDLVDGRRISVPLDWFPRLLNGSHIERSEYEFIGKGTGIHWPQLDEDISVKDLLMGRRSLESANSLARWLQSRE